MTFLHYYFVEHGEPWWKAAIWPNIVASIIWGFAAGLLGIYIFKKVKYELHKIHEHHKWMAKTLHELHLKTDGRPPSTEHPYYQIQKR